MARLMIHQAIVDVACWCRIAAVSTVRLSILVKWMKFSAINTVAEIATRWCRRLMKMMMVLVLRKLKTIVF